MFVANVVASRQAAARFLLSSASSANVCPKVDVLASFIEDTLSARNLADLSQRKRRHLANPPGDVDSVIAKRWVGASSRSKMYRKPETAHVPVEIFCFHIKREQHLREWRFIAAAILWSQLV